MRTLALLVLIAVLAPQTTATARKVLDSIPDAYWGTWAAGVESCKNGDTEAIVLSAKAYAGPLGKCVIIGSVSEIPSSRGSTYSARLQCADQKQAQKKTPANLVIRGDDANQISVGPGLESLKVYQRCSESTPASK